MFVFKKAREMFSKNRIPQVFLDFASLEIIFWFTTEM